MRQLSGFKRMLSTGLRYGVLGLALVAGSAFAAEAAKPPADLILKGDAKCTGCHDEADDAQPTMLDLHPSVLAIGKSRHGVRADSRNPTCTDCHGLSADHIGYKGSAKPPKPDRVFTKNSTTTPQAKNDSCLSCHDKDTKRHQWDGSAHQVNDVSCTSCHQIHTGNDKVRNKKTQPEVCFSCHKEQRADSKKISHHPITEGKVTCSDCHSPHGSNGPKMLKKNTLNETCFTCHAEKRGPFLWEHQPVTEDCSNCHSAHGSNITPLLKSRAPFMCQECHNGPHSSSSPVAGNAAGIQGGLTATTGTFVNPGTSAAGRGCMNCHSMVHGSNAPNGAYLHR